MNTIQELGEMLADAAQRQSERIENDPGYVNQLQAKEDEVFATARIALDRMDKGQRRAAQERSTRNSFL